MSRWVIARGAAVLVAGLLAACMLSCSKDRDAAKRAADQWLKLVEQGQYDKTWDEGSQLLKDAMSKKGWSSGLKQTCEEWGPVVSRELLGSEYYPKHEYSAARAVVDTVIFSYRTTYQKKAASKEQVAVVRDPDGVWRVYLYIGGMRL